MVKWLETDDIVRFNEVDEWGIAWHGHYMAWFEVGRMALLRRFNLLPRQMVELGVIAPVIRLICDFKHPAVCGDSIIVRTTVIKPEIAALTFKFEVLLKEDRRLLAKGETTQVFLTTSKKMLYRISGELAKRIDLLIQYCQKE
jgi:acyl-CoA thioester hydrolase